MNFSIEEISKGNSKEFKKFFNSYYRRVFGYILKISNDEYLAQEVATETFVKLWNKREKLLGVDYLDAYLFRVAKNTFLNHTRSQKKHVELEQIDSQVETEEDQELFYQDFYARLYELIEELPERRRMIILKVAIQRMSYADVAEELNVSVNTIKSQRKLAMDFLKERLNSSVPNNKSSKKINFPTPLLLFDVFF